LSHCPVLCHIHISKLKCFLLGSLLASNTGCFISTHTYLLPVCLKVSTDRHLSNHRQNRYSLKSAVAMSQPQPPQEPAPAAIQPLQQPSRPPKTGENTADLAATLAWLNTAIKTIYLAGRTSPFQDGPPKVTQSVYLDITSATLNYCDRADQWRKPGATYNLNSPQRGRPEGWATADLYIDLRDAIKTHCVDIRARLFAPENSAGVDGARRLIGEYAAHWNMMVSLAAYVSNLLRYLERKWIKRCMDEGQRDIHMIKDLHTMIWKEEVLHVGVADEATRTEMDRAVALLQEQDQGGTESDRDLVERFLESLRAVGLATVLAIR
jgi:hypothetical protein